MKYDIYVKFTQIFAHNVQICAKFCCKNINEVCQAFQPLYLGGRFFVDTLYNTNASVVNSKLCRHANKNKKDT